LTAEKLTASTGSTDPATKRQGLVDGGLTQS
jgi:hypothetical protein